MVSSVYRNESTDFINVKFDQLSDIIMAWPFRSTGRKINDIFKLIYEEVEKYRILELLNHTYVVSYI